MYQNDEYITLAFTRPVPPYHPGTNGRCWTANIARADLGGNFKRAIFIHGLIVKHARPVLLTFRTSPAQAEIEAALHLAVPDKYLALYMYTTPVRYQHTVGNHRLFRADGQRNARTWDSIMSPLVRSASAVARTVSASPSTQGASSNPSSSQTTAPNTTTSDFKNCIIYIRSSTAVQGDVGTSVERQFVTLLHKMTEVITTEDLESLEVLVEYRSSSQHPWQSRKFLSGKIRERKDCLILSANPDRITRRVDEVDAIITDFENDGCQWWTLGVQPSMSQWVLVHEQQACDQVKNQLKVSREVAVQHGLYTRTINTIIRLLNCEKEDPLSPELSELKKTLGDIAKDFDHVLVWCRISPTFRVVGEEEKMVMPQASRDKGLFCLYSSPQCLTRRSTLWAWRVSAHTIHRPLRSWRKLFATCQDEPLLSAPWLTDSFVMRSTLTALIHFCKKKTTRF